MSDRAAAIRDAIRLAGELDRQWIAHPAGRDDRRCTPWMPYPLFGFIALLAEALPEATGNRFLEVGCGIGTRMLVARELFGLDVTGVERVPDYAPVTEKLGLRAQVADARDYDGYGQADVVWFNRPFRDRLLERELEAQVWAEVRPDAVVICANLESRPPASWWTILDDWEERRGIWSKLLPGQSK